MFWDFEYKVYVTLEQLKEEYNEQAASGEIDECISFDDFVKCCMYYEGGTLMDLYTAEHYGYMRLEGKEDDEI